MSEYRDRLIAEVGVPPLAGKAACFKCGAASMVYGATCWDYAEPVFVSRCPECAVLFCPSGHRIEKSRQSAGFNARGETSLIVCLTKECAVMREQLHGSFYRLASGDPQVIAKELQDWADVLERLDDRFVGSWVHSAVLQLPKAAGFFHRLRLEHESFLATAVGGFESS